MKTIILCAFILGIISGTAFAQDIIVLNDGSEIRAKVLEITPTEIRYKKFDNIQGPTMIIERSSVFMIKYENGTKDVMNPRDSSPGSGERNIAAAEWAPQSGGWSAVYVQPLGFLQFGPIVGAEFAASPKLTVGAHLRVPSLGILSYVAASDASDGVPDQMSGISLGAEITYYPVSARKGFYYGFLSEYQSTSQLYAEGSPYEWEGSSSHIIAAVNGGYRFGFESGFFLSTGLLMGGAIPVAAKWHYTQGYDTAEKDDDLSGAIFYMVQLTIGVIL